MSILFPINVLYLPSPKWVGTEIGFVQHLNQTDAHIVFTRDYKSTEFKAEYKEYKKEVLGNLTMFYKPDKLTLSYARPPNPKHSIHFGLMVLSRNDHVKDPTFTILWLEYPDRPWYTCLSCGLGDPFYTKESHTICKSIIEYSKKGPFLILIDSKRKDPPPQLEKLHSFKKNIIVKYGLQQAAKVFPVWFCSYRCIEDGNITTPSTILDCVQGKNADSLDLGFQYFSMQ